jgi:hypothetical protein
MSVNIYEINQKETMKNLRAAGAIPAFWNTRVKGEMEISLTSLFNKSGSSYGMMRPIIKMAKI